MTTRTRTDLCPGVSRPWPAEDGGLVRLRLVGGAVTVGQLRALAAVSATYGDGDLHLTRRANVQVRALPLVGDVLPADVVSALAATGLLPSPSHELVRNVLVSPLTGLVGGRADLRGVAADLDAAVRADADLADLSARFLFVLDDGRGDVLARGADVGLVALGGDTVQLRWGTTWGPVVPVGDAVPAMVRVAHAFRAARAALDLGTEAPWHVDELPAALVVPGLPASPPDPRLPAATEPPAYGELDTPAGLHRHVEVPDGRLEPGTLAILLDGLADDARVVVTPWRSLLLPGAGAPVVPDADEPEEPVRPTRRYPYEGDGQAIYVDSFATIRAEADLSHVPSDAERVVVRMVHGTGQTDLAPMVVVSPDLVGAARRALAAGAPIVADAHMVASGVTRRRLPADNEVLCALHDPRVPGLARAWGTTRSAAALSVLADRIPGSVVAIGNAPTALFHLLEMLADGCAPPAAIVGCPVGFIGAAESKEALAEYAAAHGIPFLTVHGRRGGSAMTASALNAIAQEAE
ncbi:precorrin isomerase [Nocardioides zeae]|uniref:Precorrin isomerase n=2 Tax=Nocardioides zeae TaxID=1457234 RepID=A0AAJ1TZK1_9ACTN|nr:precorrin-8X methylmutase [Nocardioides zeae]MDQ1104714.1 precorrin isomerase [Nocardioides zeae]MDR6175593.1 precorrin isomerase [Nocardioides zeae]MDR6208524.1 precorrin isomerase [Nocardioides zeae]